MAVAMFGPAEVRFDRMREQLPTSAADRLADDPHTAPDFTAAALITIDTQRDVLDGGPFEVPGTSAALGAMLRWHMPFAGRAVRSCTSFAYTSPTAPTSISAAARRCSTA